MSTDTLLPSCLLQPPPTAAAVLTELSVPLRTELMLFLHRDALERVPFFQGHDPLFITDVVAVLQLQHFAPGGQGKGESGWQQHCWQGKQGSRQV